MPRRPRSSLEGTVFHIVCRGVAGQLIFDDDFDRRRFVWQLNEVSERFGWRVIAWCLMGTHFHLVVECDVEQLSLALHRLNCLYAMYFNRRHKRRGHLFENRFSSWVVVDEAHLEATVGYVLENPVRAGLCGQASEWGWSWPKLQADLEAPWPKIAGAVRTPRGTVP
jgi:putative transposase